jgi:hypothetical protein
VAALVLSHWLLDWIAHEPDMPLVPGGDRYGLGLWRSLPATLVTELVMFAAGAWLYTRATRATGRSGRYGWLALAGLLVISFFGTALGKPPPSIDTVIIAAGVTLLLLVAAAIAVERQRPAAAGDVANARASHIRACVRPPDRR